MKSKYKSTHYFLTEHFEDLPPLYISYLITKKHPVRKIQDQFCYIHAKLDDHKVFNPLEHKRLEAVIRNNLKFFFIEYIPTERDSAFNTKMYHEAIAQKNMLKRMKFNQVFYQRLRQINYFLNYSYSRSLDYFLKTERYSPEYSKFVLGIDPERKLEPCPQM